MNNIQNVVSEILKFSDKLLTIYEPANLAEIQLFEKEIGISLPEDYKIFLRRTNGLELTVTIVYGIVDMPVHLSLSNAYNIEHNEVENEMPSHLIPFSPDGRGNHYCFDSNKCDGQSCNVVFWEYNLADSNEYVPEVVYDSFASWAEEVLIRWKLKKYDYDGNRI